MKKTILASSAAVALIIGGAAIAAPGGKGMRADTNGDGVVTKAEHERLLKSGSRRWM